MKNILAKSVMVLAAIAIMISLAVALAPDASAQGSVTAPDGTTKWMRYNMPAAQGSEATANANFISQQKTCCITILGGPQPSPDTEIGSESAASSTPYSSPSRWFCMGYLNGNNH